MFGYWFDFGDNWCHQVQVLEKYDFGGRNPRDVLIEDMLDKTDRPRARWTEAVALLAADWPVRDRRARWRLGEVTLDWAAVTPS